MEPPFESPLEGEPGDMGRWVVCTHGRMWVKWDEPLCDSALTGVDPEIADLLYVAWTVIANAPGWGDPPTEWRQAAEAWRDRWYAVLERRGLADWTDASDPTSMTGHAREATEHEVAGPPTPGQPTGPTEQADLQGEPTTGPRSFVSPWMIWTTDTPIDQIIGEAVGAASLCWSPRSEGVFDAERANVIVDAVMDVLRRKLWPDA